MKEFSRGSTLEHAFLGLYALGSAFTGGQSLYLVSDQNGSITHSDFFSRFTINRFIFFTLMKACRTYN